jgi:hypothetical protein
VVNAFARSNLSVAIGRLAEAQGRLQGENETGLQGHGRNSVNLVNVQQALWCVTEAIRLIENAGALDDMESADSVPAPDSNTRRMGT